MLETLINMIDDFGGDESDAYRLIEELKELVNKED